MPSTSPLSTLNQVEDLHKIFRKLENKFGLQFSKIGMGKAPIERQKLIRAAGLDGFRLEEIRKKVYQHYFSPERKTLLATIKQFRREAKERPETPQRRQEKLLVMLGRLPQMSRSFDSPMEVPLPQTGNQIDRKRPSEAMPTNSTLKRTRSSAQTESAKSNGIAMRNKQPPSAVTPMVQNARDPAVRNFSAHVNRPTLTPEMTSRTLAASGLMRVKTGAAMARDTDTDTEYDTAPESPAIHTPASARSLSFNSNPPTRPWQGVSSNDDSDACSVNSASSSSRITRRRPLTVEDGLRKIWPPLPPFLWHAPLAVCWEVTRIALHCKVPLGQIKGLVYDKTWHDQNVLRQALQKNPLFSGKSLPQRCRDEAWEAALTTFHDKNGVRTVALAVDLSWAKGDPDVIFNVALHPLKLDLSHRLGRRFGADRFLEINVPSPYSRQGRPRWIRDEDISTIVEWLGGERYLVGRFWASFYVRPDKEKSRSERRKGKKESETNNHALEEEKRAPNWVRISCFAHGGNDFARGDGIPPKEHATTPEMRCKIPLPNMLDWALSLRKETNQAQLALKLFSRLSLSLSRTQATVVLEPGQIRHRHEDVLSRTGKVMNDGVARMSMAMAKRVADHLKLDFVPSAFQARCGSAKGLWIREPDKPDGDDDAIWIETYPSQRKWDCDFADIDHRTFEVNGYAKPLKSADVNPQFIVILCARATDKQRMRRAISALVEAWLEQEMGSQRAAMEDPVELMRWIHANFAQGYRADRARGSVDFVAGLPRDEAETLNFLLSAGFHPLRLRFLWKMCYRLAERRAERLKSELKIRIPQSTYAYMAIDFSGILRPGEVHFMLSAQSQSNIGSSGDEWLDEMEILVARSPAHFASDVQRVRVVYRRELAIHRDVILFPSTGDHPLADMLSGGDYDGDTAWICWDQEIVQNFENARVPDREDLEQLGYIRKDKTFFFDYLQGRARVDLDRACARWLASGFEFNMQEAMLGICTSHKEYFCYHDGHVESERAVFLSSLLSDLVDQAKQGIVFKKEDWDRLRSEKKLNAYSHLGRPAYLTEQRPPCRTQQPHILDHLKFGVIKSKVEHELTEFDKFLKENGESHDYDPDLTEQAGKLDCEDCHCPQHGCSVHHCFKPCPKPCSSSCPEYCLKECPQLRSHRRQCPKLTDVREQLTRDLELVLAKWHESVGGSISYDDKILMIHEHWKAIQPLQVGEDHPAFHKGMAWAKPAEWSLLKASMAFKLWYRSAGNVRFAWSMAGRELAQIKSQKLWAKGIDAASPGIVTLTMPVYASMRPDKGSNPSFVAVRQGREDPSAAEPDEMDESD